MTSTAKILPDHSPMIAAIAAGPRARRLCAGLEEAGFGRVAPFEWGDAAAEAVLAAEPDVVLIDIGDPDAEIFAATLALIRILGRPNALFVDRTDRARTAAAIDAGVDTYVVDGFKVSRLGAVIEMAFVRHEERERTLKTIADKDRAHDERMVIDRAKSILMDRQKMTEADAYAAMRRTAMNQNRRLVEIAQLVIDVESREQPGEQSSRGSKP